MSLKYKKKQPQQALEELEEAIIELYLNVKVRNSDDIANFDEERLQAEKEHLKNQDPVVIIGYIKSSIDILMNLKMEGNESEDGPKKKDPFASILSDVSIEGPPKDYEVMLQKLESDVRNHIRIEQQLKLHIESVQYKLEETEKLNIKLEQEKEQDMAEVFKENLRFKDLLTMREREIEKLKDENRERNDKLKGQDDSSKSTINSLEQRVKYLEKKYERDINKLITELKCSKKSGTQSKVQSTTTCSSSGDHKNIFTGIDMADVKNQVAASKQDTGLHSDRRHLSTSKIITSGQLQQQQSIDLTKQKIHYAGKGSDTIKLKNEYHKLYKELQRNRESSSSITENRTETIPDMMASSTHDRSIFDSHHQKSSIDGSDLSKLRLEEKNREITKLKQKLSSLQQETLHQHKKKSSQNSHSNSQNHQRSRSQNSKGHLEDSGEKENKASDMLFERKLSANKATRQSTAANPYERSFSKLEKRQEAALSHRSGSMENFSIRDAKTIKKARPSSNTRSSDLSKSGIQQKYANSVFYPSATTKYLKRLSTTISKGSGGAATYKDLSTYYKAN